MKAREETVVLTLCREDQEHPGEALRDVLMKRLWHELFTVRRFRVGGGHYAITIRRTPDKKTGAR